MIGDVVEHQEKIPETEGPRNQYETGRYRTKYTYSKGANEGLIDIKSNKQFLVDQVMSYNQIKLL